MGWGELSGLRKATVDVAGSLLSTTNVACLTRPMVSYRVRGIHSFRRAKTADRFQTMRQARPQSPAVQRLTPSVAPGFASDTPYTQAQHYHSMDSGSAEGSYPLADEPGYQRGTGAKRIATTLGRGRAPHPIHTVSVDPNARVASALHPLTVPAAQVRVYSDSRALEAPVRIRPPRIHYLRPLLGPEPAGRAWLFGLTAVMLALGFLALVLRFAVPASGSPSAHAPLLAGRLIATERSMRYVPTDAFRFVGERWVPSQRIVEAADGVIAREYFPKDPAGLPAIYAICFWLALDDTQALRWAHLVNPIAGALSVLATYFLCRFVGGSFLGLLGALVMASSALLLGVANDAAGACVSLAFVTWGFCMLVWWWRSGNTLVGFAAGALLGAAVTIEYGNALLLVPLLLACAMAWQWRRPLSSFLRVAAPIVGWALPVVALLWWNHREMGAPSAYHLGAELPVLDADNIAHNWQKLVVRLSSAYHFLLALGGLGLLTLLARRVNVGLAVLAWFLVPVLVYAAWVWNIGPRTPLSFTLIVFPPILIGFAYLLRRLLFAPGDAPSQAVMVHDPYTGQSVPMVAPPPGGPWRAAAAPLAAALVAGAAVFVNVSAGASGGEPVQGVLAQWQQRDANLAALSSFISLHAEPKSVLIVQAPATGSGAIYMLDILDQWDLYDGELFSPRFARRLTGSWAPFGAEGLPAAMSRRRYELLQELYDGVTQEELSARLRQIADEAIAADRPVYLLMNPSELRRFEQAHFSRGYELKTVASFEQTAMATNASDAAATNAGPQWTLARVLPEPEVPPATVVLGE